MRINFDGVEKTPTTAILIAAESNPGRAELATHQYEQPDRADGNEMEFWSRHHRFPVVRIDGYEKRVQARTAGGRTKREARM